MSNTASKNPINTNIVAVINSSSDVIDSLQLLLQEEGFNTVGAHVDKFKRGEEDILDFFTTHNPAVIIWDVAPPYESNWNYLKQVLSLPHTQKRKFVITSTNVNELRKIAGNITALEIIGKPFDMHKIIEAVKEQ